MKMDAPLHTPWAEDTPPDEARLRQILDAEGLDYYSWSNGPYDIYAPHKHSYDKVIYCVRGSITFQLIEAGTWFKLDPGDRLDLPAGIVHAAEVGEQGVTCLEAHL
jgi:quercetin dioxygenase-like cupin family protein